MDGYAPDSTPKIWVIRQAKNLVSSNLVRFKNVIARIDDFLVDTNVQVRVGLVIERPRIYLYYGGPLNSEVKMAKFTTLALEVNWFHVL